MTASGQAAAGPAAARPPTPAIGFTTAGSRDEVFNKVGDALAGIEGVNIASRAQLLGAFDVNYEGSNFLVRVSAAEAGAYVSAVDPRGLPATGERADQADRGAEGGARRQLIRRQPAIRKRAPMAPVFVGDRGSGCDRAAVAATQRSSRASLSGLPSHSLASAGRPCGR